MVVDHVPLGTVVPLVDTWYVTDVDVIVIDVPSLPSSPGIPCSPCAPVAPCVPMITGVVLVDEPLVYVINS